MKHPSVFCVVSLALCCMVCHAGIGEYPDKVTVVKIPSSFDETVQPALFYSPDNETPKPLLVALHTWSSHYDQGGGEVSYASWCIENNWVFIHPHFRGPNNNPKALGSEYVVHDIEDAVNFAMSNASIDSQRVYLIGASGGGHAALLLAGRKPELWAAVSAWCPIYDIRKWWHEKNLLNNNYARQIEAACGGRPGTSQTVDHEYKVRSPSCWLKKESNLPIQIATGVHDGRTGSVPFTHALNAFNSLAIPGAELTPDQINDFYTSQSAAHLGFSPFFDSLYGRRIHFRKCSGNTQVTIFEGTHEIIHRAGLNWLSHQKKGKPPVWETRKQKPDSKYGAKTSGK